MVNSVKIAVADLGGMGDVCPLSVQFFSSSWSCGKIMRNNRLVPPPNFSVCRSGSDGVRKYMMFAFQFAFSSNGFYGGSGPIVTIRTVTIGLLIL